MTEIAVLNRGTTTPDGVLVQEAAAGSGVSYGALYDRYATQVFNYCLRLTNSPEDAGDATQEAFVNVLRRLQEDDRPVLEFSSYLFAAARHESYALMRQRARTRPSDSPPVERGRVADVETDPERSVLLRDSQEAVREANAQLQPRHREVLALREVAGQSYDEIGATMGISENAAAQLIWRARAKLREAMTAGAVASVVATSDECETAQLLLSRVQDGEPVEEADRVWLDEHLDECGSCKTANRVLLEVGASYRCWLPVALFAGMRADTLTRAGALVGADWSHVPVPGKGAAAGSSGGGAGGAGTFAAATAAVIAAVGIGAFALPRDDEATPIDSGAKQPATGAPAAAKENAPTRDRVTVPAAAGTVFAAARAPRSEGAPALRTTPNQPPARTDGRASPDNPRLPPEPGTRQDRPAQPPGGSPGPNSPAPTEPRAGPPPAPAPAPRDPVPVKPPTPTPTPTVDPVPPPPAAPPTECGWPGGGNGPGGCPPGQGGVRPDHGGTPPGRQR